jgi:hypothetical protein
MREDAFLTLLGPGKSSPMRLRMLYDSVLGAKEMMSRSSDSEARWLIMPSTLSCAHSQSKQERKSYARQQGCPQGRLRTRHYPMRA